MPLARLFGGATVIVFDALSQTMTVAAKTKRDVDRAIADMSDGSFAQ